MDRLVEKTYKMLRAQGATLAIAESCTGGLLCKLFTDLPGCSDVFLGGVVSYANEVKAGVLGVSEDCLLLHGAVSEETARCMAKGVRLALGSAVGIATTGIAGPGGGSEKKPVGLVFIAVADGQRCVVERNIFAGTREDVRESAAKRAYEILDTFLQAE